MENSKLYLIKMGEIALKGLNRPYFERRLKQNIKVKLRPYRSQEHRQKGRLYLEIEESCPDEMIEKALSTTSGIVGYSRCVSCKKDMEAIKECVKTLIAQPPFNSKEGTFKVDTVRSDKGFPLSSYQISCELGGVVLDTYTDMKVKMKNPDHLLSVEIRDKAYLYTSEKKGCGGLPCTTAGKAMLLLSGGIDSPVACYRMANRGLKMEAIYFHAYPYTSELALEKVKKLASLIAPYNQGMRMYCVPFTEQQLWIKDHAPQQETTLMFRAAMMKVANMIAEKQDALAIVTGEALSQVASQTLESMCFSDSMSDRLVIRPLVGCCKQEIMDEAKEIGTYETSILPYEDCCVIFSPKHPVVRPDKEEMTRHYLEMKIEPLLQKAVDEVEIYDFTVMGDEIHRDA